MFLLRIFPLIEARARVSNGVPLRAANKLSQRDFPFLHQRNHDSFHPASFPYNKTHANSPPFFSDSNPYDILSSMSNQDDGSNPLPSSYAETLRRPSRVHHVNNAKPNREDGNKHESLPGSPLRQNNSSHHVISRNSGHQPSFRNIHNSYLYSPNGR